MCAHTLDSMKIFDAAKIAHLFPKPTKAAASTRVVKKRRPAPVLPSGLCRHVAEGADPDAPPQKRKHNNVFVRDDDGNVYPSIAEGKVMLELKRLWRAGFLTEPKRGRYVFEHNGVVIGSYTSDADFTCLRACSIVTAGIAVALVQGVDYVTDVKSPATLTKEYKRTKKMMRAFHGVIITEILTRPLPVKKPRVMARKRS